MRNLKVIFVILVTLAAVASTAYFLADFFKPKPSGLQVNTNLSASVYINTIFVGHTPFSGTNNAGQVDLKIVPDSQNLLPYETKINLVPGIKTVVDREFGDSEDTSSGDVISFDKIGGDLAGLVVISSPDNAQVWIDGIAQGFAPYNFNSITTTSHKVTVKSLGYLDRTMNVKTLAGYRLTVYAKLAKSSDALASPSPTPTATPLVKTYVSIGNTPTGYLNMRTEPATKGEEIARLRPGQKYVYLATDSDSGWYKIQYQDPAPGLPGGITGWVSDQYASIATQSGSVASPSSSPKP